jgi:hypothetical protein
MRKTLKNSPKQTITLEEEVDYLAVIFTLKIGALKNVFSLTSM